MTKILFRNKLTNQKKETATLAVLLICIFAVSLFAVPNAYSQAAGTKKTYAFVGANPNPAIEFS